VASFFNYLTLLHSFAKNKKSEKFEKIFLKLRQIKNMAFVKM